jgi:hypothetical protein
MYPTFNGPVFCSPFFLTASEDDRPSGGDKSTVELISAGTNIKKFWGTVDQLIEITLAKLALEKAQSISQKKFWTRVPRKSHFWVFIFVPGKKFHNQFIKQEFSYKVSFYSMDCCSIQNRPIPKKFHLLTCLKKITPVHVRTSWVELKFTVN